MPVRKTKTRSKMNPRPESANPNAFEEVTGLTPTRVNPPGSDDDGIELGVLPHPKNENDRYRVSIREFKGVRFLSIQGQYKHRETGAWMPAKGKSVSIRTVSGIRSLVGILNGSVQEISSHLPES